MIRGTQVVIPIFAYNPSTFAPATGLLDLAAKLSKDGAAPASATNYPAEIDAVNLPGWYRLTLTATETDCVTMVINATSATATVDAVVLDFLPSDYAKASDVPTVQAIQSGLAKPGDAMTLTAAYDAAKTAPDVAGALASYGTAKTSDLEPLVTSSELAALETHGDTAWAGATASAVAQAVLTTPADAGKGNTLQNAIRSLTGTWAVDGDTIKIKDKNGTVVLTMAMTKDADGNYTGATL